MREAQNLPGFSNIDGNVTDLTGLMVVSARGYNSIPDGWLLCDGRSLMRSEYKNLFSVIGVKFGSVDSEHFNIPGESYSETEPDTVWIIKY